MAQPPSYNRQKNFADDFGNETDHSSLNAELDRASNSINDIRSNLAILQADDGMLRPSVVTTDSISEELRISLVEGVVMDAQTMLDRSLAAAEASSASAIEAKASETSAARSAGSASESAKVLALAIHADWNAKEGPAQILNRPELSKVALSGSYKDLTDCPGNHATVEDIEALQAEIAKKGVPIGMVEYFAMTTPPPGYLKADGAAVGRETYSELFAMIGTTFGDGDGSTTFNLPDLMDRFAQGSNTPGQTIEAGLPNIDGRFCGIEGDGDPSGAFYKTNLAATNKAATGEGDFFVGFEASRSNPTYGESDTVQPPALTLLPCIKAFDAATNPGLVNMTELANDVSNLSANKLDKTINGTAVKYITETYSEGTSWYRKWSDGWVEQGGNNTETSLKRNIIFTIPMSNTSYLVLTTFKSDISGGTVAIGVNDKTTTGATMHATFSTGPSSGVANQSFEWYVCGQGVQS